MERMPNIIRARRLGLRGRIFAISLALTMAAGIVAALVLGPDLTRWLEGRVEEELERVVSGFAELDGWVAPDVEARVQAVAKELNMRVTVVDGAGVVLADSFSGEAAKRGDDLMSRPEIQQALRGGSASLRRESAVTHTDMVFAAVRLGTHERPLGALRLGIKSSLIGAAIGDLWAVLLVAGLLGLLAATVLTFLASDLFSRAFRAALARLRVDLIEGTVQPQLLVDSDFGPLAESVQTLASDLRQSWSRVERERERLEAVLEGMDDAVFAVNADGTIKLHNSSARRLVNVDSDLSGRKLVDVVRAPMIHELIERATAGNSLNGDFELPGPPPRTVLARCTPTRDGAVVVVLQDTTRVRQLERMRRDFVANVSHELRTPVSVIRANAETLIDGALEDPQFAHGFLDAMIRNADRLSSLISDLLDLARVESGRLTMERRRLVAAGPVLAAIETLRQTALNANLTLNVDVSETLEVYADPKVIEQVVVNLVHNAIKHAPTGSTVSLSCQERDSWVWVAVEDQGAGIPEAARGRVFERFYRVDKGRARVDGGTGLGLAIARHLVEAMGGEIGVDSARDGSGGAQFWFTVPRFESAFAEGVEADNSAAEQDEALRLLQWRPSSAVDVDAQSAPKQASDSKRTQDLRRRLLLMAGKVEEMIAHAVRSVERRDLILAEATIVADRRVNRDEIETDELCLQLLQEPLSSDELRFVTRASKMVTDLERIADLAVNISERAALLTALPSLTQANDIPPIAALVQAMVRDVIDSFVNQDGLQAQRVIISDDEVDERYHRLSRALVAHMSEHADSVEAGMHLQAVVKFLERIGDHATNLAEQVIFMVEGHEIRHPGKMSDGGWRGLVKDEDLKPDVEQDIIG